MSYSFYKIVHIAAVLWVFAALGGSMLAGSENEKARKVAGISHGIALILILVAGFGALAKLGIDGVPGWAWAKLALWLLIGGLAAVPRRAPHLGVPIFFALPVLGGIAAWLAIAKPF